MVQEGVNGVALHVTRSSEQLGERVLEQGVVRSELILIVMVVVVVRRAEDLSDGLHRSMFRSASASRNRSKRGHVRGWHHCAPRYPTSTPW